MAWFLGAFSLQGDLACWSIAWFEEFEKQKDQECNRCCTLEENQCEEVRATQRIMENLCGCKSLKDTGRYPRKFEAVAKLAAAAICSTKL